MLLAETWESEANKMAGQLRYCIDMCGITFSVMRIPWVHSIHIHTIHVWNVLKIASITIYQ